MPARNLIRVECENSYYHIYNRGVDKMTIFADEQDYSVFLKYLKDALDSPPDISKIKESFTLKGYTFQGVPHQHKNFYKKVSLICYCLIQNHFHFILHQKDKQDIKNFMQAVITRYSMYFNKKYKRVGGLFQGTYKSILVDNENYLLHLSRYIHLNPSKYVSDLKSAHSSYAEYLGERNTSWVKPKIILSFFETAKLDFKKGTQTYKDFVEKAKINSKEILGKTCLEEHP